MSESEIIVSLDGSEKAAPAASNGGSKQPAKKLGLTTADAEKLYAEVGFNELPHIDVSLYWLFFAQFTGVMPYMLEIACILALAVESFVDFAIIAGILISNGFLGFTEELKAKHSLDALTEKMEQTIPCIRDGAASQLLTRLLVPGDIILLMGGASVPADVEWLEGDVLSIDTAALTGEPLPRKYPSSDHGNLILCGSTVVAGEAYCVVRKTGVNTEIGGSQAAIMQDKAGSKISLFEEKVLHAVKVIISIAVVDVLIIFFVQGLGRNEFTPNKIRELIASCLSIVIASVPVALPLVLQVTMALGAGTMARDFNAVVTSLPALQDISSMSVLCSDKTGTLTTAKISIHGEMIWANEGFTKEDVAYYAALASNRDKKEDPIDRAVIHYFDRTASPALIDSTKTSFTLKRSIGFNPIYKRVLYQYTHPKLGLITIAKGLPNKVVDTADGGEDDAEDQWKVSGHQQVLPMVQKKDHELSKSGYKTLGVSVKIGENNPFKFVGILPMIDPPRHDTALTIKRLKHAGISVKMITGDHQNIAIETARLIGMGLNIHKGEEVRVASHTRDEMVMESDGFAQVLPRDKREVVLILKKTFNLVVGMTGDGVNDAPALSAAQCGIAVDDATDAAKNAAAIILTTPGLSAIYYAILESRRIFRKLKAYIIYRFAATIQIVTVLTLLIYISQCSINSFYIILLALLNDLTLLPIAYDRQSISAKPDYPDVTPIMITATILGFVEAALSLLWAYASFKTGFFGSDFDINVCSKSAQAGVWVQMTIAAEWLIFSVRNTSFFYLSNRPSYALIVSINLGCLIVSILATASEFFGSLYVKDVAIIWLYNLICLIFIDGVKVLVLNLLGESSEVLDDSELHEGPITSGTSEKKPSVTKEQDDIESRGSGSAKSAASSVAGKQHIIYDEDGESQSSRAGDSAVLRMDRWYSSASLAGGSAAGAPTSAEERVLAGSSASSINLTRKGSNIAVIAALRTQSIGPHAASRATAAAANTSGAGTPEAGTPPTTPRSTVVDGKISFSSNYASAGSMIDLRHTKLSSSNLRPYTPGNLHARK